VVVESLLIEVVRGYRLYSGELIRPRDTTFPHGMIIASGNTQDVYTCPASGYTRDQVSSFNVDTPYYCFGLVDDTGAQIPMVAAWVISADSNDPYYTLEYFSDSNCRNILAQPTAYGCCCSSPVDASNNPISAQSAVIY
jgi:hypothetical protein